MATVSNIGLEEPSTITKSVATATLNRNGTVTHQELLTLAGAESSLEIARVMATTPASSNYGVATREIVPSLFAYAASTTGLTSTGTVVVSSAATVPYVTSFTVASTVTGPADCGFYAGGTLVYPVTVWAGGGFMNTHAAVPAPAFLFKGTAGESLTFNVPSSGVTYRVQVSYYSV